MLVLLVIVKIVRQVAIIISYISSVGHFPNKNLLKTIWVVVVADCVPRIGCALLDPRWPPGVGLPLVSISNTSKILYVSQKLEQLLVINDC